jgi:hypothetical protein
MSNSERMVWYNRTLALIRVIDWIEINGQFERLNGAKNWVLYWTDLWVVNSMKCVYIKHKIIEFNWSHEINIDFKYLFFKIFTLFGRWWHLLDFLRLQFFLSALITTRNKKWFPQLKGQFIGRPVGQLHSLSLWLLYLFPVLVESDI